METWKTISEYSSKFASYSISNMGRVRNDKTSRILKTSESTNGYLLVILKNKIVYIHSLVARNFIGPKNNNAINHKDGNRKNNNIDNLEYTSQSENAFQSFRDGNLKANNNIIITTIRVDKDLHEKLREESFVSRKSINSIIVECLEDHYGFNLAAEIELEDLGLEGE